MKDAFISLMLFVALCSGCHFGCRADVSGITPEQAYTEGLNSSGDGVMNPYQSGFIWDTRKNRLQLEWDRGRAARKERQK